RGAYFRYGDLLLGQGREHAKSYLADNPELVAELEQLIRNQAGLRPRPNSNSSEAADDEEFEAVEGD
ncbi:MAG: recombinase RecA, partial [Candidatus Promineifilaceae bacterium]